MGFIKPYLPDVDPDNFLKQPLMERMRILATDWAENGFGSPKMIHTIYIVKLVVFFALGGITVATATSGLPAFWHVSAWWNQPIVYQKVILWTVLLEAIGVAGSWGPLAGKVKPMTGGILFWARPGTIRLRPWKWVPFTNGDRRTWFDIALYLALLVSLAIPLLTPGVHSDSLSKAVPDNISGLVNPALLVAPIALLVLIGLRDKTIFLAARGEQYLPVMVIFTVLPFVNMIIALKMVIVVVWIGAGFSKFGKHFSNVIPPMVSNTIFAPTWVRRAHYREFPRDMRPSRLADFMAHVNGTTVEILAPLVLFFSTNKWVTLAAVLLMVGFHLFIVSTFPLAVPLEWNVVFAYTTIFLFLGFPNWNRYAPWNMTPPWLALVVAAALLFYPVLGNLRPDKVSFLPSMRQYAGNWASALWAFAPGAERKLNNVTRSASNQLDQFVAAGYEPRWAEITLQKTTAWRSMHSQGRGLYSLLLTHLPDIDGRAVREGEFVCNSLIGFNFGDGHLHNADMIRAVQREAAFEPGECVIAWVESEAFGSGVQHYQLIDAALGVVERGTWKVADAVADQPWLPNGPIPTNVEWSLSGSKPAVRDGQEHGHGALA
ncbi:DUF3556 domain-containing protein [Mycobacterium sp. Aquia_216]|uniref:DUF3556 domain-containing protein n=1 Tax=Mycobacterium sp. Aquia_216 TaxID=2991729 RepID=UPI00227C856C|nr:DUF3556 domain-containing protein [Mycobacterium sp. Aquia_216]WAJ46450.1 DUF3556 domain-containing protein [Mycobacterium sp. Aquia_216]